MNIKDLQKYTDETTATRIMYLLKENNLESNRIKMQNVGNKLNEFNIKEAYYVLRSLSLGDCTDTHFDIYYGYLVIIKNMIEEGVE